MVGALPFFDADRVSMRRSGKGAKWTKAPASACFTSPGVEGLISLRQPPMRARASSSGSVLAESMMAKAAPV